MLNALNRIHSNVHLKLEKGIGVMYQDVHMSLVGRFRLVISLWKSDVKTDSILIFIVFTLENEEKMNRSLEQTE